MTDDTHHPPLYYDPLGRPIGFDAWRALFANDEVRFVARDTVLASVPGAVQPAAVRVVTAWLGSDQRPGGDDERPLIFGTCCFFDEVVDTSGRTASAEVEWYATKDDARAGHAAWVAAFRHAPGAQMAELHDRLRARAAATAAEEGQTDTDDADRAAIDRSAALFAANAAVFDTLDALRTSDGRLPGADLARSWTCPGCGETLDTSAERSHWVRVCTCRRFGVDWDRPARLMRVIGPSDEPLPRWGW